MKFELFLYALLISVIIGGTCIIRGVQCHLKVIINDSTYRIRKQKHKRCLSTAKMLDRNATNTKFMLALETDPARIEKLNKLIKHYYKWSNKWLEIANQFKR